GLVHFTRACPGPWPGQGLADYYESLVAGREGAAHTAFDTLKRILAEGRLKASGRLIRGSFPVISFTSNGPTGLANLVRWRRTWQRWTVEPYGLIISRKKLRTLGATPVIYGDGQTWSRLPPNQRYRFQMSSSGGQEWRAEKEWRLSGDLELSLFASTELTIVLPSMREAEEISVTFGYPTLVLDPLTGPGAPWRRKK
ncbi:MAG: hypothetical protein HQK55_16875, partial [Deltaproteobacteria bacterium]|nr:hypothetical protein [Deltaproteobacteria bacterium]